MEQTLTYKCLDPRGNHCDVQLVSPVERISNLKEKTVYFVDIGKRNSDILLKKTMTLLQKQFPDSKVVYFPKTTAFQFPEPEGWWQQLKNNADAAVIAVGD